jgi:hypothetical protein
MTSTVGMGILLRLIDRTMQAHPEGTADADLACHATLPAHSACEFRDNCETETEARAFSESNQWLKDAGMLLRRNACTGVCYREGDGG